jgi:polar amino acid transport system ATP-binding protein
MICGARLVFMHEGRVHEQGAPKTLFAAPQSPELQQFIGASLS